MKRFTLLTAALLLCGFSMNAQSSCATAQTLTVANDASSTVTVSTLSGDPTDPTSTCVDAGGTFASNGAWYSYTPTTDVFVTITTDLASNGTPSHPDPNFYYPVVEVFDGTCAALACIATDFAGGNGTKPYAEVIFYATSGTTYYIAFTDLYSVTGLGTITGFDFEITTDTDTTAPGVATNPTPADQATDVAFYQMQDSNGMTVTAVDFAWDAPTTGGPTEAYEIVIDTDPTFSTNPISGVFSNNVISGLHLPGQSYFTANTTYYWNVTPINTVGPTTGTVVDWSFTTGTLGIENNNLAEISLYPNPVVDVLNITLPSSVELQSATMHDLLGKQTQVSIGENNTINMSQMAAGVYILKLETNQGTMTQKVIKN